MTEGTRNRDRLARIFADQTGLVLTTGYLLLTAVGIGYQFAYLHQFNVNALDYAEVSDFLLAALREPAVLLLVYFFFFVLLYAEWKAAFVKRGAGIQVRVTLQTTPTGGSPAGPALLLGKTSSFIFLYYPSERRAHVVPIDNLARLVVEREVKPPPP